jgi:hypothetical protein
MHGGTSNLQGEGLGRLQHAEILSAWPRRNGIAPRFSEHFLPKFLWCHFLSLSCWNLASLRRMEHLSSLIRNDIHHEFRRVRGLASNLPQQMVWMVRLMQ